MFRKGDKTSGKQRERKGNDLADMLGIGGGMMPNDDDDDESLEAELAAIQGRPMPKKRKEKKNEKLMPLDQITKLANDSMKDIDGDVSDEDIENDDDLMGELNDLLDDDDGDLDVDHGSEGHESPNKESSQSGGSTKLLEERKEMYVSAIQSAKAEGASSKVRRYDRGLKEIDRLLKLAKAGKPVKEDDIPPPVVAKGGNKPPPQPQESSSQVTAESQPTIDISRSTDTAKPSPVPPLIDLDTEEAKPPQAKVDSAKLAMLTSRRDEYKQAALQKKREGDLPTAKQLLGISKRFDSVIMSVEKGENVDTSDIPPPASELLAKATSAVEAKHQEVGRGDTQPSVASVNSGTEEQPNVNQDKVPAPSSTAVPAAPTSMLEALQQRLEKYNQSAEQAKAEGNGSKARRMGRIVKQYQDAIKAHNAGRSVDLEELPTPPGFPPLPGSSPAPQATSVQSDLQPESPVAASETQQSAAVTTVPSVSAPQSTGTLSRNEKELQFLLQRQKDFKTQAINAKKAGDIESAKNYLRQAKGLEPMITSAQNGLRVDITSVPKCVPFAQETPSATDITEDAGDDFESISIRELQRQDSLGDSKELYVRLEQALKNQIETSQKNVNHYKLLGDLTTAQNFLALMKSSQQDLDSLKVAKSHKEPVPKFHYENKTFPIVRSHPNLSDSEAEITVMRCINIPLPQGYQPKDMYVYVNYEFPFPSDGPQTGYTETMKQTINPEFNKSFKVTIDRKSRALQRVFRRQGVTFTVMYNRGFLKSDKALGQANVKLDKFMNKCKIHECVDLMDTERGRKPVGGKIEVMIKLREPLVDKDAEVVEERWLVLDTHLRSFQMRAKSAYGGQRPNIQETYESLEVYKLEKEIVDKKIAAFKSQGKGAPAKLAEEQKSIDASMKDLQQRLTTGGISGMRGYLQQLESGLDIERGKAQNFLKAGDKTNAKLCLAKKKLLDKEISALRQRIK